MSEKIASDIEERLRRSGADFRILEHAPVFTSEQAAIARGVELRTGVKALVCKTSDGGFLLALCPADRRVDLGLIARLEGTKRICLASPEEVREVTDCEIGSVPPFGHRTPLKTYMDRRLLENERVNFNIGLHTRSASIGSGDLLGIIHPVLF